MNKAFDNFLASTDLPIPQSKPENELQVANNAGGFTFEVSPQQRLERFLILGTDGGTYYVPEKDLTQQNVDWLIQSITLAGDGGFSILETLVEVSTSGRAFRNSAAIFTLALLFKHAPPVLKPALKAALPKVCRTGTHLFEFCNYIETMHAWGRSKREAVASWYTSKDAAALAYQAVKYRQRNGWTHRDAMRLSHPKGVSTSVGDFILGNEHARVDDLRIIEGFKLAQSAPDVKYLLQVLSDVPNLPWEAIPTQFLTHPEVWKKLFYNGQLAGQALVRNIVRLSRNNAFGDLVFARDYATKLVDPEMIVRTRLHPINYLNALVTYTQGQVRRGPYGWVGYDARNRDWEIAPIIADALNTGFYEAFKYVEPANKRTMLALDVSGSMGSLASGLDLTCAQVAAAMAMSIARSEPYYDVMGFADTFRELNISPSMRLDDIVKMTANMTFGSTDCAQPMLWASARRREIDTFVVITDNETWHGQIHPHKALERYRQELGVDAKLVVAALTSTGFTIADPRDRGMLDVVGADANLPKLVSEFSAGRI